jgi:hypothetical protein
MIAPAISTAWAFSAGSAGLQRDFSAACSRVHIKIRTMVAMDLINFSKFPAPVLGPRYLAG